MFTANVLLTRLGQDTKEPVFLQPLKQAACKQVHLWRLPELSASTGNSSDLIGAVAALDSTQPWDGQALGSLAMMRASGAGAMQLLVAGDGSNARLALYAVGGRAAELQHLQVQRLHWVCACSGCWLYRLSVHDER